VVFYAGAFKIGEDFTAPYSVEWIGAGAGTYYITARALDNFFATTTSDKDTITITNSPVQLPLGGTAWPIPGKIQAENFDVGGSGVAYYDNTAVNSGGSYRTTRVDIEPCTDVGGGFNVGWVAPGEWLEYTVNVTASESYRIKVRVATMNSGKKFHLEMDGVNISGDITVPYTGGWQSWATVTINDINLTAGNYVMRIVFDHGDFNLNYVEFVPSSVAGIFGKSSINNEVKFYPNPSKGIASMEFNMKRSGEAKILILDLSGKEITEIFNGYLIQGEHQLPVELGNLEKGFYICRVETEGGIMSVKIMKE
jgi:hypothetical protein